MKHQMEVERFIKQRFNIDCNWLDGNCYYFAVILKARFPQAIIFYDIINCHFLVSINNKYYDWTGEIYKNKDDIFIEWEKFDDYDSLRKERIIRNCIY